MQLDLIKKPDKQKVKSVDKLSFPECKQSCKFWDLFRDEEACREVCKEKFE